MRSILKNTRGFTLIELVMVIVIIGILAASVAPMLVSSMGAYNNTLDTVVTLDKIRYATERMARELREVRSTSGNYDFTTSLGNTTTTTFVQGTTGRTVTIAKSGANVTLSYSDVAGGAQILTDEVSDLSFAYFDENGNPTTDTTLVRYVGISLELSQGAYTQRTRVRLRNL